MKIFCYLTLFTITIILFGKADPFIQPGTNGRQPRKIVGGERAKIQEYPFMLALENGYTWQTCGAMLISRKHALTAAHCIVRGREDNDPYMYQLRWYNIVSGDSNRDNMETIQVHVVERIDVHKSFIGFPPPAIGDIAILTLKDPISIDLTRQPAALPTRKYHSGEHGVILGWGWTEPENSVSTKLLRKAPMTIQGDINYREFAAIERDGIAFCNGDSGGPFYINGEIYGIISNSIDCTGKVSGVFTNVYDYRDWIEQVLHGEQSSESAQLKIK